MKNQELTLNSGELLAGSETAKRINSIVNAFCNRTDSQLIYYLLPLISKLDNIQPIPRDKNITQCWHDKADLNIHNIRNHALN